MSRRVASRWTCLGLAALAVTIGGSCTGTLFDNQTAVRRGTIAVQFINSTPFRASFSFGTYDQLDRNPPGQVTLEQLRLDGNATSDIVDVPCRRLMAIGTQAYVDRVVATKTDQNTPGFDAEAFSTDVNFSSAAADSPGAGLPTQGTADGIERLLGVDFSCSDLLIYTFVEDPNAVGGFRIDFQVIVDTREN